MAQPTRRPGRRGRTEPVVIDGQDHLTTAQTAAYLGVRTQTVYAYVSRGLLARTTIAGQRGSFFPLSQVEELQSRGRTPRSPGAAERIHTHITLIGAGDTLAYRGRDVSRLVAEGVTYEEVCALLWRTAPVAPVELVARPGDDALLRAAVGALPPRARGLDLLKVCVDLLGAADPLRADLRPEAVTAVGARILGASVDALTIRACAAGGSGPPACAGRGAVHAAADAPADGTSARGDGRIEPIASGRRLAERLAHAFGGRTDDTAVALLDAALCLLADHDLAISTRAARVAASGRAHPYAVMGAALGAMDSPLHGMAPRSDYRIVGDAIDDLDGVIGQVVASGRPPAGFGQPMYRLRDPRADALATLLCAESDRLGGHPAVLATHGLVAAMDAWAGTFANSDLWLATLAHVLGWPAEAPELVFVIARMAGWLAHVMEEYEAAPLRYRIAGVYAGVRPEPATGPEHGRRHSRHTPHQ